MHSSNSEIPAHFSASSPRASQTCSSQLCRGALGLAGMAASWLWVAVSPGQADLGSGACLGSCLSDPQDFLSQYGRRGSTGAVSGLVSAHPHLLLPGSYPACPRLILMAKEQAGPPQCTRRCLQVDKGIRGGAQAPHVPSPALHWELFMAQLLPPKETTHS